MLCPVCSHSLKASRYEGLPVFRCESCHGYLVASRRVTDIQRRNTTPTADLVATADVKSEHDSLGKLKCPRCRRDMEKELHESQPPFHIDKCSDCDFVWFDVGELERTQLEYEVSPHGMEAARMRERHENMSEEQKEVFAENLAKLPEGDASLVSAFGKGLIGTLTDLLRGRW